jgi:hypothetical protein
MAFNPFHSFRKHQRKLLAALAVFCMFMFVLSSGLGRSDAVYQVLGLFGATRGKGSVVATLHGRKVTEGDIAKLRHDREMASTFLFIAARSGAAEVLRKLQDEQNKGRDNKDAPPPDREISSVLFLWGMIYSDPEGRRFPISRDQRYDQAKRDLQTISLRARFSEGRNPDLARQMNQLAQVLAFEVWTNDPARRPVWIRSSSPAPKEFFFGGTTDTADLLDFMLWEQQADRLGIVLTEADVIAAVNREAMASDPPVVSGPTLNGDLLAQQFTSNSEFAGRGTTPDQLAEALKREFRFVLAQEAVLGREGGVRAERRAEVPQMPAAGTPREFLDWFRANRTTLKVAVLPVPVEQFVGQVKETPSESTLRDLYNEFKSVEPSPDQPTPGFKEPRRVRVVTVTGRADSEFYLNAARAQVVAQMAGAVVGGPFGGPISAAWPVATDPIWKNYSTYASEARSWISRGVGVGFEPADRKPLYAAVAGLSIGATPYGQLATATTAAAENAAYNDSVAKLAGSLLPAGAGGQPLAAVGLPFPYQTTVLPADQMTGPLFAKVVEGLAQQLLIKNLDTLMTELAKLKNRPSDAQAYVDKAVKEFGLTLQEMTKPRTSYELDTDPALRSLRTAVEADNLTLVGTSAPPTSLARELLSGVGVFDPRPFPASRFAVVKEPFVWWRVEDLPARERPFEVVRGQVEAAWRLEQARILARAEAERIEAAVRKNVEANKSAAEAVKVLRSYGHEFELTDIARLLPENTSRPEIGQPYVPYVVPHDRIQYPRPDFVDRLLTLKSPGDVTVVRDRPAANLYVAVLVERSDPLMSGSKPNLNAFLEEYRNADKVGSMWQQMFMADRRRAYVREVERQMRIDAVGANGLDEQGNFKLPDTVTRGPETESTE